MQNYFKNLNTNNSTFKNINEDLPDNMFNGESKLQNLNNDKNIPSIIKYLRLLECQRRIKELTRDKLVKVITQFDDNTRIVEIVNKPLKFKPVEFGCTAYKNVNTSLKNNNQPNSVLYAKTNFDPNVNPNLGPVKDQHRICSNCCTTTTPAWRRGKFQERLCNACGLYLKINKKPRKLKKIALEEKRLEMLSERNNLVKCMVCGTFNMARFFVNEKGDKICVECNMISHL